MDVVLHSLTGHLLGGGKHGGQVDIKANIGEGGRYHLGTPVVPILPHLRHQHPGATTVLIDKVFDVRGYGPPTGIVFIGRPVDARHRLCLGNKAAVDRLQSV